MKPSHWIVLVALAYAESVAAGSDCYVAPFDCYPAADIRPDTPRNFADESRAYAQLAWQDFVALNFPAAMAADGRPLAQPSKTRGLNAQGGSYTAVWEVYPEARDVFRPNAGMPEPFGSGHDIPAICVAAGLGARLPIFRRRRRELGTEPVLDEYIQADRMGPIIDQSGRYVRYGIHFNQSMFDYIVAHHLYSREGQARFDVQDTHHDRSPVQFPRGRYGAQIGSIFVKAAWKILDAQDDPSTFYRVRAYIYDALGGAFHDEPTVASHCEVRMVGLVGFHIVHFTQSAPQGVWATFEHVNNAPWLSDFRFGTPARYTFFDPARCASVRGQPACQYDALPAQPWNPQRPDQPPTQLVRIAAPGAWAIEVNRAMKRVLQQYAGQTVWANYYLADVQFPTAGTAGTVRTNPDGVVATPSFLANTTMETYIPGFDAHARTSNGDAVPASDQMTGIRLAPGPVNPWQPRVFNRAGGAERVTSSCIGCHLDAAMTTGASGDFVFALDRAAQAGDPRSTSMQHLKQAGVAPR